MRKKINGQNNSRMHKPPAKEWGRRFLILVKNVLEKEVKYSVRPTT